MFHSVSPRLTMYQPGTSVRRPAIAHTRSTAFFRPPFARLRLEATATLRGGPPILVALLLRSRWTTVCLRGGVVLALDVTGAFVSAGLRSVAVARRCSSTRFAASAV